MASMMGTTGKKTTASYYGSTTTATAGSSSSATEAADDIAPLLPQQKEDNDDDDNTFSIKLLQEEIIARDMAQQQNNNSILLTLTNFISTIVVFFYYLVSIEMIISVCLSVGFTIHLYYMQAIEQQEEEGMDGGGGTTTTTRGAGKSMNFTLLSFAVVSPITLTINFAFRRREDALHAVADFRATLLSLYQAYTTWDWGFEKNNNTTTSTGRSRSDINWLTFSDESALSEILKLSHEVARYLTLPNYNRARHRVASLSTCCGIIYNNNEAKLTKAVASKLYNRSIMVRMTNISRLCETLKREGLPPNEATRIRQYERCVMIDIEKLRNIKEYRTPQALRTFGRVFSILLPPFYAPSFADIGVQLHSLSAAILFACLTSIALTGLFETASQIEDPFNMPSSFLDGVHVVKELVDDLPIQLLQIRKNVYPDAPEFQSSSVYGGGSSTRSSDEEGVVVVGDSSIMRKLHEDSGSSVVGDDGNNNVTTQQSRRQSSSMRLINNQ